MNFSNKAEEQITYSFWMHCRESLKFVVEKTSLFASACFNNIFRGICINHRLPVINFAFLLLGNDTQM